MEKIHQDITEKLFKIGYTVEESPEIDGIKPDLYGVRRVAARRVMKIAIKIESAESVSSDTAKDAMNILQKWSDKFASRRSFVFVPAGTGGDARKHLSKYDEFYEYDA